MMIGWKKLKGYRWVGFLKKIPGLRRLFLIIRYGFLSRPYFSRMIEIPADRHTRFYLDYTFGLHQFDKFGVRHNAGYRHWIAACRGKKTVFDVGAHIGLYSLPAGQVIHPQGRVYAFEPSKANGAFLRRHAFYNRCRNITLEPVLVGAKPQETVAFFEHPCADPMNALVVYKNSQHYKKVCRRQITLDEYCEGRRIYPDVIKIDVEGAELEVLKGAAGILREKQPVIFLSVHPKRITYLQSSVSELMAFIESFHYQMQDSEGQPVKVFEFGEYMLTAQRKHVPAGGV